MNSNENNRIYSDFLCFQLTALARKITRIHNKACSEYQITSGQSFVLLDLLEYDGSSMSEIAGRIQLELPAVTGYIDRLIKEDLVARVEDPNDRRLWRISLTQKGRELAELLLPRTREVHDEIVKLLKDNKCSGFKKCLSVLKENL